MKPGLTTGHLYIKVQFILEVPLTKEPVFVSAINQAILITKTPTIGDKVTVWFDNSDHQKVFADFLGASNIATFR